MRATRVMIGIAATLLAVSGCGSGDTGEQGVALPSGRLRVVRVAGEIPVDDPLAALWDGVPETRVPLLVQDVAEPRLEETGVEFVRLQAAHDGSRVVFRARWGDGGPDALVDVDRSTDGFALQFPATGSGGAPPDAMMGETGKPVAIVHWSFGRQEKADGKPHGIAALYPNATTDHYPPDAGRDEETRALLRTRYSPARAAGNEVARERPSSAVSDLVAEGFGTLGPAKRSVSTGRGVHRDGTWIVVLARPLDAPGAGTSLVAGGSTYLATAVWNGGAGHSGALKMRSNWVRVEIEGGRP